MYKCINGWTKEKMKEQIRLKNNGTKSSDGNNCVYETRDGNHCAIGCFIPENHNALKANFTASALYYDHPELEVVMPLNKEGLTAMQKKHDTALGCENIHDVLFKWIDENVTG